MVDAYVSGENMKYYARGNERGKSRDMLLAFEMNHEMKIKQLQLKAIEARRYIEHEEKPRQIRIDHNSTITQVRSTQSDSATVEFQYTASYGPVGMIKIDGSLVFEHEDVKKIVDEWMESRKMPNPIASQIHTAVMHSCVPEAVGIAKDLGLPPPIPLPQVQLGADPKKGGIVSGPEIA